MTTSSDTLRSVTGRRIREHVLRESRRANVGHIGSSLSIADILAALYGGILRIEGVSTIPWIRRFLATADDPAAEAALALAGTHAPQAFEALREEMAKANDPWWRSVLLSAISLTRQDAAVEFLRFVLSRRGQQAVIGEGNYLPLTVEAASEELRDLAGQ